MRGCVDALFAGKDDPFELMPELVLAAAWAAWARSTVAAQALAAGKEMA